MTTYKYFPSSRASFFDNRNIRLSQPTSLNDPHECLPLIEDFSSDDFVETVITRRMALLLGEMVAQFPNAGPEELAARINHAKAGLVSDLEKNKDKFASIAQQRIRKRFDEMIGILSLSKIWDVKLLWSHYAEAYRGFAVGLDTDSSFFQKLANEESDIGFLEDVAYVDVLPRVRVDKLKLPRELFYTKQSAWSYECEQRLVRRLNHGTATGAKDVYGMPVVLFEVPIEAIREIIIGFQAPANIAQEAERLRASAGGGHIQLFKARFSPTTGELERLPL